MTPPPRLLDYPRWPKIIMGVLRRWKGSKRNREVEAKSLE